MARIHKWLPSVVAPATCAALQLWTPPAQADEAHEARVLYQKGNAAFRKGDSILARDYYRKSLELNESFDTLCNLGRAEAQDKLFREAYEHLSYCVELYPTDPELADAREKFVGLKHDVRGRLASDVSGAIDAEVAEDLKRRAEVEAGPASGLEDVEPTEDGGSKSAARMPVAIGLGVAGLAGVGLGVGFFVDAGAKKSDAEGISDELKESQVDCAASGAPDECGELVDRAEAKDRSANIGTIGVVAGGALVAGAVVTYLLWPKSKDAGARGTVTPVVGELSPRRVSAGLRWRF